MKTAKKCYMYILSAFLILAFVFSVADQAKAAEQKIRLRFAHEASMDHPEQKAAERMKAVLKEKTGDRIAMAIYPSAQLGSSQQRMTGIVSGSIEMGPIATFGMIEPKMLVLETPYLFQNFDEIKKFQKSDMAKELLAFLEKHGVQGLGFEPIGFRNIGTTKKQIKNPADLKGVLIRAFENEMLKDTLVALGASVTVIPYAELYTALQTGTVAGEENPYINKATQKYYEVEKYVIETRHMCNFSIIGANKKWWDALSPDDQGTINRSFKEYIDTYMKLLIERETTSKQTLIEKGVKITEINNYQPWKDLLKGVYDKYDQKFGAEFTKKMRQSLQ